MRNMKTSFSIGMRGIRKWTGNLKVILLAVYMMLNVVYCVLPILRFANDVGIGVCPYLFPFMSSDLFMQVSIMLGAVLLFCDAPFIDESAPYVILRSGRYSWSSGQVIYILLGSALYVLFIVLCSILFVLPNMQLDANWGKVIGTLCLTGADIQYGVPMSMNSIIFYNHTALEAMGLSMLLTWLAVVFIGLLMYALNTLVHKAAGSMVACGTIVLNYFIYNFLPSSIYAYSPMSLSNLSLLDSGLITVNLNNGLTAIQYSLIIYSIVIVVLALASIFSIRKRNIVTIISF